MSKIANYLQQHLSGEVVTAMKTRRFFATDASIITQVPQVIIFPRTTNDVRKTMRFTWQLAEKGHVLPVTARGSGTDQTGAAIGEGIVMVFPAHMQKIMELDTKTRMIRVQPGMNFKALQEAMATHGLFLPPFPTSLKYSTIGGAIANNTSGEKAIKYGSMRNWTTRLEVVLANGEVIQTGRLTKRELNAKKGVPGMEGEIYRALDGLINDNVATIAKYAETKLPDSTGFAIDRVKSADGSFDLTPLFVGSQGSLGVITQAILKLAPRPAQTDLVAASLRAEADLSKLVAEINKLEPSGFEFIDGSALVMAEKQTGNKPDRVLTDAKSEGVLLVEFDDLTEAKRVKKAKKAAKILSEVAFVKHASNWEEQEEIWDIRHSVSTIVNFENDGKSALPITTDAVVPIDQLETFLTDIDKLLKTHHVEAAIWGHIGDGNVNVQPLLDLKKLSDRQRLFKFMKDYFALVKKLGGSIAGERGDGRLRVPFAKMQYGNDMLAIFEQVKQIFDPRGTLNPGVKVGTELKDIVAGLRNTYDLSHLAEYQPRM